jgi:uncharacterized lipoprotein YddW (UPF0748 family)
MTCVKNKSMKSVSKKILSFILVFAMMIPLCISLSTVGHAAELEPSSTSGYTVYRAKNYLFGVKGSTTVSEFKKFFSGQSITVTNTAGSNLMNSAYIPTGSVIKLMSGSSVLDTLTVIVGGDVNSDGKVNVSDTAVIKSVFKNNATLSDPCFHAADADGSGALTVTDYIMVKRQVAGTYTINKVSPEYVPKITVPDVTGYTAANAKIEIERKGFVYKETLAFSNSVLSGYVISQNPSSSKQIPGSTVTVVVSKGKEFTTRINYLDNMKAIWLTQFDLGEIWATNSASSFRANIKAVLQKCQNSGFNTVFVQCRPNGDATYKSNLYPWSKYVFGYGAGYSSASKNFDPLAITIEEGHKLNLSVHGWINPLRLMSTSEIAGVPDNYKIKQWYNSKRGTYVVAVGDYYYLNPAYAEVRQLIIDGVKEILQNYNVDGMHIDDYFYPTTESFFDQAAFNASGYQNVFNFRRYNMNLLVSGIYSATKSVDIDLVFGASPAGNPSHVRNNHCADVSLWCSSSNYIDYIMPQLYYGFDHPSASFTSKAQEWSNIVTSPTVRYYVGLALYKAVTPSNSTSYDGSEWYNSDDIIKRQIQYCDNSLPKCKGVAMFSYLDLASGNADVTSMIPALKAFKN